MNMLNDTPGYVGIKTPGRRRGKCAEKAETARIFEEDKKDGK